MSKNTVTAIIFSIILFTISVTVLGLMIYVVNEKGKNLSEQVLALQTERSQDDSYYKLIKISEETKEQRHTLQNYFLARESNSIDLLNSVETLASQVGVYLKTEGLDVVEDSSTKVKWIEASFSFVASREKVENFIKILETLPYVLRLTSADLSSRSATEWEAKITMQVQVLNYEE